MRKHSTLRLAAAVLLAALCSVSAYAKGVSIDGRIEPEEWGGAAFATLFTSTQESGCAVSYADLRAFADASSGCIYFAFQVIDEAFTGAGARSRVHISFGDVEITLSAEGEYQSTPNGCTVRAAGFYQSGNYNRDYALEAAVTCTGSLPGGKLPVFLRFTDGAGRVSKAYELAIDTGIPPAGESTQGQTKPEPSASPSARPEHTADGTQASKRPGTVTNPVTKKASSRQTTRKTAAYPAANPKTGSRTPGDAAVQEAPVSPFEEVTLPATGEAQAGRWSAKRIVACTAAGLCILAAALLFLFGTRKKNQEPKTE